MKQQSFSQNPFILLFEAFTKVSGNLFTTIGEQTRCLTSKVSDFNSQLNNLTIWQLILITKKCHRELLTASLGLLYWNGIFLTFIAAKQE